MALDNLVNCIKKKHRTLTDKLDSLYYPSLAFITVKGLDVLSTSLSAKEYGISGEQNPLTRYAMEQLGVDAGLMVKNVPFIAAILGAGYILNRANRDSDNRVLRNMGSVMVSGITLYGIPIIIRNFVDYF